MKVSPEKFIGDFVHVLCDCSESKSSIGLFPWCQFWLDIRKVDDLRTQAGPCIETIDLVDARRLGILDVVFAAHGQWIVLLEESDNGNFFVGKRPGRYLGYLIDHFVKPP